MTGNLPSYRIRLVHLTAVWAFGVSQPVFALIGGNPDLLLSRDATRASVALFAVLLAVVPPAFITAYAWLAGKFSPWIGDVLYLFAFGACLVPVAARLVKRFDSGLLLAVALLGAIVVAGVIVYARSQVARLFVGYSIVLPAISLIWFVHGLPQLTDTAEAAAVRVTSPAPVIFVVLDEFPASSLMKRDGDIDSVRYPNFARLAREGTWYRNATTVHEWTSDAVPSMLSGQIGGPSTVPILHNHPENLFTLLGGAYSLRVHETATRLCPRTYCPRSEQSAFGSGYRLFTDSINLLVPRIFPESMSEHVIQLNSDISMPNGPSSRSSNDLQMLLGEISRSEAENVLFFTHQLLPHAPWRFFPSGAEYDFRHLDGWFPTEYWADDPWLVLQGYQRHLLQVGYVDSMVGRVLRRLDREGLYDQSMIIVVGDHGASFRAGEGRRPLTENNLADITNIPLFVKYPKQRRGEVESRLVRSVDILPTIADVLGIRLPWEVDGVSLLGPISDQREIVVGLRDETRVHASLAEMIRDRESTLRHKYAEFGEGHDSLFRIGTHKALLGRNVAGVDERSATLEVRIENEDALLAVRRASGFLPARISGYVSSGRIDKDAELAVAVNGRVQGLTTPFWDEHEGVQRFRSLVPETAFREGVNTVEVFFVRGRGKHASLVSLGSSRAPQEVAVDQG
jgi:hypothetical protein